MDLEQIADRTQQFSIVDHVWAEASPASSIDLKYPHFTQTLAMDVQSK